MVKQERAIRTRQALLQAAASQFESNGYAGTSLSQISQAAAISTGALTFHFASKQELAEAVEAAGRTAARAALDQVTARTASPLRRLVDLTLELTRLLHNDATVRCAVRLERERPGAPAWSALWLPAVRDLAGQAHAEGELRPTAPAELVTALAGHLINGAQDYARHLHTTPDTTHTDPAQLLENIWTLILNGITTTPHPTQNHNQPTPSTT